jgi:Cu+-exporting ATPase
LDPGYSGDRRVDQILVEGQVASSLTMERQYSVQGLKCGGCVAKVSAALQALPGVTAARVDLASKTAWVDGDVAPAVVIGALKAAGYVAELNAQ